MSASGPIPVFVGPSLPPALRPAGPFDWQPPATAGDLLDWLDRRPARLCLIDGLFDSRPAPWHKELMALMAAGTVVLGAASMGALRAAELDRFGMIGVGAIYRAYRDGRLHGDDEVALAHAGGELGWRPLSVPMIEVRATLAAACRRGVIAVAAARRIRAVVHEIHFTERDWSVIGEACRADGLGEAGARLAALHVPMKRLDALACLEAAGAAIVAARPCPSPPETCFLRGLAASRDEARLAASASSGPRLVR